jgi:nucleoside-diphosphate-sugar epimerase
MDVLIVGGAGYLGNALTKTLIEHKFRVTVIDKMVHGNYNTIINHPLVRFIEDDILNIEEHINDYSDFDKIIYLASPRLQDVKNDEIINKEIETLKKTIEITKNHISDDFGFWFMSSCSVYGKALDIVNEETEPVITSLYAKLKVECEKIIQKEDDKFKILRLSTLYGRGTFDRNDILINNLISNIKNKKKVEIWDPDVYRPHLHINDAAILITNIIRIDYNQKILNVGFEKLNISKRELLKKVSNVLDREIEADYLIVNDSRNYKVDFSRFNQINNDYLNYTYEPVSYEEGIFDLYVGEINFSHEDYDSIIEHYRPNGSSSTWYLKEEGKLSIPKMWGNWNLLNGADDKLIDKSSIKNQVFPPFRKQNINYYSRKQIGYKNHIYFIPIFNPDFFEDNKEIGFSCISQKFLDDVRSNRCKIVMYLVTEGHSGGTDNNDLEIIQTWIDKEKLPAKNIYYLHGNLKIDTISKNKGYKFNCIGVSSFDVWLNSEYIPFDPIEFIPHPIKYLYLSYNRNHRYHRLLLCSKLLKLNLLNKGLISLGNFNYDEYKRIDDNIKDLKELVPIEIDKSIDFTLANNITPSNYEQTFLSLVSETLVDSDVLFISEKIWKPIYMGHPFIILGNPQTIKKLKEMGYKTFDKWWDESYDDELDFKKRIEMITNIIKNFEIKSKEQLIGLRQEMVDVLKHNQEVFRKQVTDKYNIDGKNYVLEIPILKIISDIYYN